MKFSAFSYQSTAATADVPVFIRSNAYEIERS